MATTRLIAVEDAPALAELLQRNRAFLADWDPIRPEDYFTLDGQRRVIAEALECYREGVRVSHVILDDGHIVDRVTLSNIVPRAVPVVQPRLLGQSSRKRARRRHRSGQ